MRKLVAILMACTSVVACSGSSTGGSDPIPLDQIPTELAKSYCAAEQACAPFFYGFAFANTDCVTLLGERLKQASYADIQSAVTAGTVKYDGDKARSCANAISAGACTTLDNNAPDVCQQALVGTVATDGACSIDEECAGLSRCDVTGAACPGKCAPRSSAGVSCGTDDDCDKGLLCSAVTSRCVAPAAEGEACGGSVAGACAAGLLCIGDDTNNKKAGACKTPAETLTQQVDQTCDVQKGPWCAAGLDCVAQSYTVADGLTAKCAQPAAPGGACGIAIPGQCPVGQYCPEQVADLLLGNAMSSCVALPVEGAACGPQVGVDRCAAGLVCDEVTTPLKPTCVTPKDLGEPCGGDTLCVSQHCVASACVPASPCAK